MPSYSKTTINGTEFLTNISGLSIKQQRLIKVLIYLLASEDAVKFHFLHAKHEWILNLNEEELLEQIKRYLDINQ